MREETPLVALEGIKRKLGVYPALKCFQIFGLVSPCRMKIRIDGHYM